MIGHDDTAIQSRGITAFLLHRDIGDDSAAWRSATIEADAQAYRDQEMQKAESGSLPLVAGRYVASAGSLMKARPAIVTYYIDGSFAGIVNSAPYVFEWNSRSVKNGEHVIEARAQDSSGNLLQVSDTLVYVRNRDDNG
jgi:hypothetical protein